MREKKLLKKEIGMDDLAIMVQGGFVEVGGKIKELREDMNTGFRELRGEMNDRFDIVENKLIAGQTREIEKLRDKVLQIEVKLAKLV